jgi:signal transduction histidine kinase
MLQKKIENLKSTYPTGNTNWPEMLFINDEKNWLNSNLDKFCQVLYRQKNLKEASEFIISKLVSILNAKYGQLYLLSTEEIFPKLILFSSYACKPDKNKINQFSFGEGLVGQCAEEKKIMLLSNTSNSNWQIKSSTKNAEGLNLIMLPVIFENDIKVVIEIGSTVAFSQTHLDFLEQAADSIGIVINTIETNLKKEKLLKQLADQGRKLSEVNERLEIEIKNRVASEEKINELNKRLLLNISHLESKNKELDQFAFIASHDLQEPLRKIRTFSDRVVSKYHDALNDDGKMYMDKMQDACARMQNLINDILSLSKISISKDKMIHSDMNVLLDEVIADMDIQIQEKNAHIVIDKLPKLTVYPAIIKPLFQNIISNSLKYSKKDTRPNINITYKIDPADSSANNSGNRYCRIFVEDNGIGFEQQYAEQIFTMFKRLHGNSEYSGTGIGLAISKKIIDEHNGFIIAESSINIGTTITLGFPINAPAFVPVLFE